MCNKLCCYYITKHYAYITEAAIAIIFIQRLKRNSCVTAPNTRVPTGLFFLSNTINELRLLKNITPLRLMQRFVLRTSTPVCIECFFIFLSDLARTTEIIT